MIVLALSMIFLNFTFSFLVNFVSEVRYLYIKEQLVIKSFRLAHLHTKGFKDGSEYISGVISLETRTNSKKFTANDGKVIEIVDDNNYTKINNYTYKELETFDSFEVNSTVDGLYSIGFSAKIKNLEVDSVIGDATITYQRLVYTK